MLQLVRDVGGTRGAILRRARGQVIGSDLGIVAESGADRQIRQHPPFILSEQTQFLDRGLERAAPGKLLVRKRLPGQETVQTGEGVVAVLAGRVGHIGADVE